MTRSSGIFRSGDRLRQRVSLLFFFLLIAGLAILIPSHASSADQNPIRSSRLSQKGSSLIVQIRTSQKVNLGRLDRRPDFANGNHRYLCLQMNPRGGTTIVRICLGGRSRTYRVLGVSRTSEAGRVRSSKVIRAEVKRVGQLKLVATFDPAAAGLPPGNYAWRIADHSGECPPSGPKARPTEECLSYFPPKKRAVYRLRPIRVVGCTGGNGELVRNGPRGGKRVALTFDDGPSDYTPEVLHILKRKEVKATFFMLGQQVTRYPSYARRVLALGHEIGNHSYDHALLPVSSDIRHTNRSIIQATHFRPCLFRPPYGAVSSSLVASARAARMKVVDWDVDTTDWKLPGAGYIKSNVLGNAHSGSIVLMHDGGGPRSQTVEALPGIIDGLRGRGYRLVTVSQLLGNRMIYRPVP